MKLKHEKWPDFPETTILDYTFYKKLFKSIVYVHAFITKYLYFIIIVFQRNEFYREYTHYCQIILTYTI